MEWKDKELEESEAKWITGLPTGASPDGQPQAVHRLPTRKIDPLSKGFIQESYARIPNAVGFDYRSLQPDAKNQTGL